MSFIKRSFDVKKCARELLKNPGRTEVAQNPDALSPGDLNPMLYPEYIRILRSSSIRVRDLDFNELGEGDIDDLENVLYYSPANRLFEISEVFRGFDPSSTDKRIFI